MKFRQRQVSDPRAQQNFEQLQGWLGGPWHNIGATGEPAFTNGWVNYDTARPARYRVEGGRCFLDGVIKNGTVNLAAFDLPVVPDPGGMDFAVNSNGALGLVTVTTAGVVTPFSGSNVYFFLAQINFAIVP